MRFTGWSIGEVFQRRLYLTMGLICGKNKELQELVSLLDKDKINDAICNQGIKWHFNPPLVPPFGGVHETLIKAAK